MFSFRFRDFFGVVLLVAGLSLCSSAPCIEVTLVSPRDDSVVNNTTVTFTCSATDEVGLLSATLYIGNQPQTVTFSGPDETVDAQISADQPNTNFGNSTAINVDGLSPHAHAVIKFLNVFGDGPGQVPPGSSIVSATLEVNCFNFGNIMRLYRLTKDWSEDTVTWNFPWPDPGADGPGSNAGVALDGDCTSTGWRSMDITPFVQEWSGGASNYGIVLTDTASDGVDFDSSEGSNPPVLRVSYQTEWLPDGTQTMSGTSDTATFTPVELTDQNVYVWNCLVTNTSGGESWAPADFRLTVDTNVPNKPVLVAPPDEATGVSTSPTLEVSVSDPQSDSLDVSFYGSGASGGDEFTIIALPDTQKYALSYPDIFTAQTQWIADNASSMNIVFVTHEGDIVDTWDSTTEWERADTSMSILDGVVPYGVSPGNHDQGTTYYNQYFPYTRYETEPWYGGHRGDTNDTNYSLFSAGGDDYVVLQLEFWPSDDVIAWADLVLKAHSDRKAIITTHGFIDGSGNRNVHVIGSTQYIWDGLVVPNDNVYFVLCGHVADEYCRTDVVNGREVHQLLADYQSRTNGGDGWLRIMRFVPAEDRVYVETYSPYLDQYETDAGSQFALNFPMSGYSLIGTNEDVASGGDALVVWPDLSLNTEYQWFVTVTDALGNTQTGPTWQFRTFSDDVIPPIISSVDAVDVTDTGARVIWITDEPADSLVEYGLASYGSQASDAALVTSHSIALTDLTPNAIYYYRVTSKDSSNNSATSSGYTFTTLQEPPPVYDVATSDFATEIGAITGGTYLDTHDQNDLPEALTEAVKQAGKPSKRHDELSHIWTFDVTGGNSVVFWVDAWKSASPDGDDFVFSYSSDGASYVDMLVVTKTSDDSFYQSYTLPNSLTGTVYVRVQDTDRSAGNQNLDTLYVDEMYILCGGSPPDLPPDAPQNLIATGGDGQVNLDWDDNTESDLAYYVVYRSEGAGGPYGELASCFASMYVDDNVVDGTTYYYVVTAVDAEEQESGLSNEASATPGVSPTIRVASIAMRNVIERKKWSAVATVTVTAFHQNGVPIPDSPVEGALVSYEWSGVHNGAGEAMTDSTGMVTVTSSSSPKSGTTYFTVVGVSKVGCDYDEEHSVTSASISGP